MLIGITAQCTWAQNCLVVRIHVIVVALSIWSAINENIFQKHPCRETKKAVATIWIQATGSLGNCQVILHPTCKAQSLPVQFVCTF